MCVAYCQLECSCMIFESKNDDICQIFNKTALNYLIEKNEVQNEFVYFNM